MIDFPVDSFFPPSCGPITITSMAPSVPIATLPPQVSGATDTACDCGTVTIPIEVTKPKATCGCK